MKVYIITKTFARGAIKEHDKIVRVMLSRDKVAEYLDKVNTKIAAGRGVKYTAASYVINDSLDERPL